MCSIILTVLISRFVDRDMFMRFRGGGVGYKVTRESDDFLQSDRAATKVEDSDDKDPDIDMDASEKNAVEDDAELDEDEDEDDREEDPNEVIADSDEELDYDVLEKVMAHFDATDCDIVHTR
jgi:hypothetical protein